MLECDSLFVRDSSIVTEFIRAIGTRTNEELHTPISPVQAWNLLLSRLGSKPQERSAAGFVGGAILFHYTSGMHHDGDRDAW